MSMLPQPPPDATPPPPGAVALRSRKIRKMMLVCGIGSMALLALGVVFAPLVIRSNCGCHSPLREAVNNARYLGLMMLEFEMEYGSFPDAGTIPKVNESFGTSWKFGATTSNDFFRQLLAANIAGSERIFYVRTSGSPVRPDNDFSSEAEALKKGECGFTYLRGATTGDNSQRPLVVAPMIPGTRLFDRNAFEGKAVILRLDNSAITLPIDRKGRVMVDGMDLMDPKHPVWDGRPPVIAWPDV